MGQNDQKATLKKVVSCPAGGQKDGLSGDQTFLRFLFLCIEIVRGRKSGKKSKIFGKKDPVDM